MKRTAVYKKEYDGKTTWSVKLRYTAWNGERKQKKKEGFKTKREAQEWESDFLNSCKNDVNMSFKNLVEKYMEDCSARLAKTTLANKRYLISTKITPYFGKMALNEITVASVRKWQNTLIEDKAGYASTYLKSVHNQLSAIFNFAVKYFGLPKNPASLCGSMGKKNAEQMQFWTLDEFMRFIGFVDDPTASVVFNILFYSGIREGELLALTPGDFSFSQNSITITKSFAVVNGEDIIKEPKTPKSKRVVAMPEPVMIQAKQYISQLYGIADNDRIFSFTKKTLYSYMAKYCAISGVKQNRVHDIRHSHASMLIELGVSPLVISERLGHENIQTTLNTYSHLYPNKQNEIANLLSNKIESTIENK